MSYICILVGALCTHTTLYTFVHTYKQNLESVYTRCVLLYTHSSIIGDAHLTEDGGGARGPSEPQCLARRTLGT
jgi:hypothetical protein